MKVAGIDVGTSGVKVVLLQSTLTGCEVLDCVAVPYGGRPLEEATAEALGRLADPADLVCVGLNRAESLFRTVVLPFSDAEKVARAAPFAAEDALPISLERLKVAPMKARPRGDRRFDVGLQCVPREMVEERRGLVESGEVQVQLDAVAAVEAMLDAGVGPRRGDPPVVLVDLGEAKTCIEVVDGDGILTSRCLRTGLRRFAETTASALGVGEGDPLPAFREAFEGAASTPSEEAQRALLVAFEALSAELARTILSLGTARRPARVYLTGGGARLRFLTPFLGNKLQLPVEVLAAPRVAARGVEAPERFSAAFGLALSGAERGKIALRFDEGPLRKVLEDPWVVGVTLAALVLAGLIQAGQLWLASYRLEEEASGLRTRVEAVLETLGLPPGAPLAPAVSRTRKLLDAFRSVERSPSRVLDAIAEAVPVAGKLVLTSISLDGATLVVQGAVDSFAQAEEFAAAVRDHPGFADVTLEQSAQASHVGAGARGNQFTLRAELREDQF